MSVMSDHGAALGVDDAAACPACGTAGVRRFLHLGAVPALANAFPHDAGAARRVPRGDLDLGVCARCGLIANVSFDPRLAEYDPDYENSQTFSPAFRAFMAALARHLVHTHGLRGATVCEIGPGDGDFLRMLVDAGVGRGLGYDPAYSPSAATVDDERVRIEPVHFRAELAAAADYVVCRHVLEHLADPVALVEELGAAPVGGRRRAYIEVPDADAILDGSLMWDLVYEHHTYFTAPALVGLLRRAGFGVTALRHDFDGQVLAVEVEAGVAGAVPRPSAADVRRVVAGVEAFAKRFGAVADEFSTRLDGWAGERRRVAVWGAGSKGVTFCNVVPGADAVAVVDVSPRKHGRYVPGTGQAVLAPADLGTAAPDVVLVMNPRYTPEIRAQLAALDVTPELVEV